MIKILNKPLSEFETDFLAISLQWYPGLIKLPSPFVAGGFMREIVSGGKPSDMDLFFRNEDCFNTSAKILQADPSYFMSCESEVALTFDRRETPENRVQLIRSNFGGPEKILKGFDFKMCMIGLDYVTRSVYYFDNVLEHIEKKIMAFNSDSKTEFNVSSLKRLVKFASRGYTISNEDLKSFAEAIAKLGVDGIRRKRKITVRDENGNEIEDAVPDYA